MKNERGEKIIEKVEGEERGIERIRAGESERKSEKRGIQWNNVELGEIKSDGASRRAGKEQVEGNGKCKWKGTESAGKSSIKNSLKKLGKRLEKAVIF